MIGLLSQSGRQAEGLCHSSRGQHTRVRPRNTIALEPSRPVRASQFLRSGIPRLPKVIEAYSSLLKGIFEKLFFPLPLPLLMNPPIPKSIHPAPVFGSLRKAIVAYCRLRKTPRGGGGAMSINPSSLAHHLVGRCRQVRMTACQCRFQSGARVNRTSQIVNYRNLTFPPQRHSFPCIGEPNPSPFRKGWALRVRRESADDPST
jgi:hypothetical protein